jgi:aconitate hydratase
MTEPLGYDPNLEPIYLKDIWPSLDEINAVMAEVLNAQ